MFATDRYCDAPEDDAVIWRYTSLTKLISLLRDNKLHLARLDQFRDPHEGSLAQQNVKRAELFDFATGTSVPFRGRGMMRTRVRLHYNWTRQTMYANCWHINPDESAAMWDLYGSNEIAIRSTYGRLRDSLDPNDPTEVVIGKVTYHDYRIEGINDAPTSVALSKRLSFEHEHELRALTIRKPPESGPGTYDWTDHPTSIKVSTDVSILIERIYVDPNCGEWVREVLEDVVKRFELSSVKVVRSDLYDPRML